eukprot:jgi/Ulvmu1/5459/UM228_0001.1
MLQHSAHRGTCARPQCMRSSVILSCWGCSGILSQVCSTSGIQSNQAITTLKTPSRADLHMHRVQHLAPVCRTVAHTGSAVPGLSWAAACTARSMLPRLRELGQLQPCAVASCLALLVATLAPTTAGQAVPSGSAAMCSLTGGALVDREVAAGRAAAANATAFICGTAKGAAARANEVAESISAAVAAEVLPSEDCFDQVKNFRLDGLSIPSNEARAIADAFQQALEDGLNNTSACARCGPAAASAGAEFEDLYVGAVEAAEHELQVNYGPLTVPEAVFVQVIVNATAAEFAAVLLEAQAAAHANQCAGAAVRARTSAAGDQVDECADAGAALLDGIAADVFSAVSGICARTAAADRTAGSKPHGPSGKPAASRGAAGSSRRRLFSEASASSAGATPSEMAELTQVLAGGVAQAVRSRARACTSSGACGLAMEDVDAAAADVAGAFASAFATARATCKPRLCRLSTASLAKAVAEPLAAAATKSAAAQCQGPGAVLNETRLEADMHAATLRILPGIVTQATGPGDISCRIHLANPAPKARARRPAARKAGPQNNED